MLSGVTEYLFLYLFINFFSRDVKITEVTLLKQQLTLGSIFETTGTVVRREQQEPV